MTFGAFVGAAAQPEESAIADTIWVSAYSTPVSSTAQLSSSIQSSINTVLRSRLGGLADSARYVQGEVRHFNNTRQGGLLSDSSWVVPMYDLRFDVTDTTLGIGAYALELRMDSKGRLIYMNWPETGYADHAVLPSWQSVLDFATAFAKRRKFYSSRYTAHLQFNESRGRMTWIFRFPVKDLSNTRMLHSVEIDWLGPELVREYMDK